MKSLFNENECYTTDALNLSMEIERLISPIIKEYCKMGYSTYDIGYIVENEVALIIDVERLKRQRFKYLKNKRVN